MPCIRHMEPAANELHHAHSAKCVDDHGQRTCIQNISPSTRPSCRLKLEAAPSSHVISVRSESIASDISMKLQLQSESRRSMDRMCCNGLLGICGTERTLDRPQASAMRTIMITTVIHDPNAPSPSDHFPAPASLCQQQKQQLTVSIRWVNKPSGVEIRMK